MKQFNLNEYIANPEKKIATCSGKSVRVICTDKKGTTKKNEESPYCIIGLVAEDNGHESTHYYNKDGINLCFNDENIFFIDEELNDDCIKESIMRFIYDAYIHDSVSISDKNVCEQWINYLKRQGEHKLEDIEDEAVRKYMKLDKFALANMLAERDKINAKAIEAIESIEEQPSEWSEEDEEMRLDTIRAFYLAYPYALESENPRRKNIDWLKSLPERFNLQSNQEWSEEDEKMVRFYEADYNHEIGDMSMKEVIENRLKFKEWLTNKLKSLRPKSEGVYEAAIKDILKLCESYSVDGRWCIKAIDFWADVQLKCKDILKADCAIDNKPNWKPSEEQMKALKHCVDGWQDNAGSILDSLYSDLKTL